MSNCPVCGHTHGEILPRVGLTEQQLRLLHYIGEFLVKNNGLSPSFEEMKVAMDLQSKSGVHRLIVALEERGYIRRLPNRARALAVINYIGAA